MLKREDLLDAWEFRKKVDWKFWVLVFMIALDIIVEIL